MRGIFATMVTTSIATMIGGILLLAASQVYAGESLAGESLLVCTFFKTATLKYQGWDDVQAEIYTEKPTWTAVFAELDSNSPKVKSGGTTESTLHVVRRGRSTLWLAELAPLPAVNLWTIFFDTRMAIYSHQSHPVFAKPLGILSMGWCK